MNVKDKENPKYPLTHPQKRIWYLEKICPDTPMHNIVLYCVLLDPRQ